MFSQIISLLSRNLLLLALHIENGKFPKPLSAAEEARCIEQMLSGDASAREKLIVRNLRLVAHIAKKYYSSTGDSDDLISIGTLGLIKATDTFRQNKKARFSTYAARCIENEILMELRSGKRRRSDVSVNEPLETDKSGNELYISDILSSDGNIGDEIENAEQIEKLKLLIGNTVTGRESRIIKLRYGIGGGKPHTQQQTARLLGISRSYVSRIENDILKRLRRDIEK